MAGRASSSRKSANYAWLTGTGEASHGRAGFVGEAVGQLRLADGYRAKRNWPKRASSSTNPANYTSRSPLGSARAFARMSSGKS